MAKDDRERNPGHVESEYKVTDRRLFTAEGVPRNDAPEEAAEPEATVEIPTAAASRGRAVDPPGFERRPLQEPEGVDFTMLINAMAEPALLFLGEIPHPATGQPRVDLERARLQIDMLDLLRVKCRGNLSFEEDGLLDRILYQLRMLYVSRAGTSLG